MRGSGRILNDSVRDRLAADGHAHLVRARRNERTRDVRRPENHSGKARRVGIAHVPEERVHAVLVRRRAAPAAADRSLRRRRLRSGRRRRVLTLLAVACESTLPVASRKSRPTSSPPVLSQYCTVTPVGGFCARRMDRRVLRRDRLRRAAAATATAAERRRRSRDDTDRAA